MMRHARVGQLQKRKQEKLKYRARLEIKKIKKREKRRKKKKDEKHLAKFQTKDGLKKDQQ